MNSLIWKLRKLTCLLIFFLLNSLTLICQDSLLKYPFIKFRNGETVKYDSVRIHRGLNRIKVIANGGKPISLKEIEFFNIGDTLFCGLTNLALAKRVSKVKEWNLFEQEKAKGGGYKSGYGNNGSGYGYVTNYSSSYGGGYKHRYYFSGELGKLKRANIEELSKIVNKDSEAYTQLKAAKKMRNASLIGWGSAIVFAGVFNVVVSNPNANLKNPLRFLFVTSGVFIAGIGTGLICNALKNIRVRKAIRLHWNYDAKK